jgi:hypothetical protein
MESREMTRLFAVILMIAALFLVGCDNDTDTILIEEDVVPATPQGVGSVTGDGMVYVLWNGIYEYDVDYYTVYRSLDAIEGYTAIAHVDAEPNPNLDLQLYTYPDATADNGETYWYAVTAVDYAGQESELSAENVFDTPRPDGVGVTLLPADIAPTASGFNLPAQLTVDWDSPAADIFVDRGYITDGGPDTTWIPYINAGINTTPVTDIQDLGYRDDFDEVGWAPEDGWSLLGYAEAIVGHVYVVWTSEDHFAKIWVTAISATGAVTFDWAYQTSTTELGRLELAPRPPRDGGVPAAKPTVTMGFLKSI